MKKTSLKAVLCLLSLEAADGMAVVALVISVHIEFLDLGHSDWQ